MRPVSSLLAVPAVALLFLAPVAAAQTPPPGGPPAGAPQAGPAGAPPGAPQAGPPRAGLAMGGVPRSAAEVGPWADRLFMGLDANADGAITGSELAVLSREPIASMGGGRLRAMVSQSDANRDARVSREEFAAGALRAFHRMDANGDGQLSDEEMPRPAAPPSRPGIPMPSQPDPMPMPMPDGSGG